MVGRKTHLPPLQHLHLPSLALGFLMDATGPAHWCKTQAGGFGHNFVNDYQRAAIRVVGIWHTPLHCDALQVLEIVILATLTMIRPPAHLSAHKLSHKRSKVCATAQFTTTDAFHCASSDRTPAWALAVVFLGSTVMQVSCWVLALLFLCRASVLIERASYGGDGLSFERLLRSRMRRRVVCNGGLGLLFATILHLVLPYYGGWKHCCHKHLPNPTRIDQLAECGSYGGRCHLSFLMHHCPHDPHKFPSPLLFTWWQWSIMS